MNDSWRTSIDKLMVWRAGTWVKHEITSSNLFLRITGDQLFITADQMILETLNMQNKIKGVYKEDILILILCHYSRELLLVTDYSKNVRKIKFRIQTNQALCYQMLGKHFPVVCHNSKNSNNNFQYRNATVVLKAALEQGVMTTAGPEIPDEFKNFVKLCLLDPTFPKFVQETKSILQEDALL